DWLLGLFQGDLGQSFYYNRPVSDLIADRLPATLRLAFVSLAVTMLVSVPLGIVSAMKQNKITDKIIRFITFGGISIPGFWVGMILMYVFALQLNMVNVTAGTGIKGMVLPVATLVFAMASKYTRYIRTAVLEEWSEPYVFALKAKGISKPIILSHYVLKSTMLSVVTMVGLSLGSLLGGAIVVEIVFSWPGVGQLAMDAIHNRDYPLIQGYVVWMSILYVGINFLVDVSYKVLDPRLRLEKGDG
ncbi:MAG TPA: nickel ABC transporter permease subunit NikB, partial [Eubacteriaceae bacterium]|nr:nickel ABC transporter permease subunit NikB [Eubacteriaceae bacterium]